MSNFGFVVQFVCGAANHPLQQASTHEFCLFGKLILLKSKNLRLPLKKVSGVNHLNTMIDFGDY